MSVTEQAGKAANSVSSEKDWENPASHEEELEMPSITQQAGEESSKGSSEKKWEKTASNEKKWEKWEKWE